MVDCGIDIGVFFAGGGGGILFDAGIRVCYQCANGVAIIGNCIVVPVAAS